MERKASFYMIFNEDHTERLCLPEFFVMGCEEFLPKRAKLRIGGGETWNVKLEKTEFETWCFTKGWAKFVTDFMLESGLLLLFSLNAKESTFDVSMYGKSHCLIDMQAVRSYCLREFPAVADDGPGELSPVVFILVRKDGNQRRRTCAPESEDAGTDHDKETNAARVTDGPEETDHTPLGDELPVPKPKRAKKAPGWMQDYVR